MYRRPLTKPEQQLLRTIYDDESKSVYGLIELQNWYAGQRLFNSVVDGFISYRVLTDNCTIEVNYKDENNQIKHYTYFIKQ